MFNDFFKPAIEKTIAFIEANNLWSIYIILVFIILISFGLGYVASWIISQRKLKAETKKIDIDSQKEKLSILEKIQNYRSEFIQNSELITILAQEIIDSLKNKDLSRLESAYEEFNNFFFNTLLVSFFHYLESIEIYFNNDRKKRLFFIDDEIFRLYKTINLFLKTVNNNTILKLLQKNEVKISKETLNPTIRYVKNNTRFYDFKRRSTLKKYLSELEINS